MLTRGKVLGFEYNRMVVQFTMMDGCTDVPCAISTDALDRLDPAFKIVLSQREVQFLRLRDRIEMKVQEKFRNKETEGKPPGIVLRMTDF